MKPTSNQVIREPLEWRALRYEAALAAGFTLQEVGKQEGITRERVRQIVASANDGGGAVRQKYRDERILESYRRDPVSIRELAARVGVGVGAVLGALKRAGIPRPAYGQPRQPRQPRPRKPKEQIKQEAKRMREERIARGKADPSLIPHGTLGAVTNWGCRCEVCLAAVLPKVNRMRRITRIVATERAKRFGLPPQVKHGSTNAYTYYGCKCQVCRDANAKRRRECRKNGGV